MVQVYLHLQVLYKVVQVQIQFLVQLLLLEVVVEVVDLNVVQL